MKMKKLIVYSLATLIVVGALGAGVVYAFGPKKLNMGLKGQGLGYENMFERKAELLNMTVEELKQALESGKTFWEIAEEKGLSWESLYEKTREQLQERLSELIAEGKMTQEQADKKLEWLEGRQERCASGCLLGTGGMGRWGK